MKKKSTQKKKVLTVLLAAALILSAAGYNEYRAKANGKEGSKESTSMSDTIDMNTQKTKTR